MTNEIQDIEQFLLETEEGREFLEAYKLRVIAGVSQAFSHAISEAEGLSPVALIGADLSSHGSSDVIEVTRTILDKINNTREELKSISEMARERKSGDYSAVGDELDAVRQDTEEAANTIMDGVEEIESVLKGVVVGDPVSEEILNTIHQKCGEIVIACSFQDITSQRVQKVVGVLQDIDYEISRIDSRLKSPVRSPADHDVEAVSEEYGRDQQMRDGLLDGPALPDNAASQDDIDSLFDT